MYTFRTKSLTVHRKTCIIYIFTNIKECIMSNSTVKKLGFWSIVLYSINSIIGSGIFLTPGGVVKGSGVWAPLVYLLAGVFATVLALVFASAAKYVKKNGAAYAYTKAAFGDNVSIFVGITRAIAAAIAWGVLATALLQTFYDFFFPQVLMDGVPLKIHNVPMLGGLLVLVGILFTINMFGNRIVEMTNNISTIGKLAALILFVVSGIAIIFYRQRFNYGTATSVYKPSPLTLFGFFDLAKGDSAAVVATIFTALYAYTGFESIANAAEEMENPEKNLPRAIPIAMVIIAIVYMSTITVAMILGAKDIGSTKATIALSEVVLNPVLKATIQFGAFVSIFGINIAASFGAPRVFTALAENGILPKAILTKNKQGVPVTAFILTVVIALAFPLVVKFNMATLTGISVISRFIQFIIVPVAVMVMASSKSKEWAHITRNMYLDYVMPIIGLVLSIILVVVYDYKNIIFTKDAVTGALIKNASGAYVTNWMSIGIVIALFGALPALGYYYFHVYGKKVKKA